MKKPLIVLVFVLIILLICFAVSSILATIGYIAVQTTQQKFRDTVRLNDVRSFTEALEGYYTKYGTYPKLDDSAVLSSIENVTGKKDVSLSYPSLNFLDPKTGANTEFSVKLTAPGLMIYTGTGNDKTVICEDGDKIESNVLRSSPSTWQIFYNTNGNAPQKYRLLTCTEEGWITSYLGTKVD